MAAPTDLRAFVVQLTQEGHEAVEEIHKDTYWWFLEVLPPKYFDGSLFAFAEGMEPLRLFWVRRRRYFCRVLSWAETRVFCAFADIPQDYWTR